MVLSGMGLGTHKVCLCKSFMQIRFLQVVLSGKISLITTKSVGAVYSSGAVGGKREWRSGQTAITQL